MMLTIIDLLSVTSNIEMQWYHSYCYYNLCRQVCQKADGGRQVPDKHAAGAKTAINDRAD
jgi:hypothetical protein